MKWVKENSRASVDEDAAQLQCGNFGLKLKYQF
jgi:hypothetical protein